MRALKTSAISLLVVASTLVVGTASAQLIIRNPGDHPDYRVEIEPHGTVGLFHRNFGGFDGNNLNNGFGNPDIGAGFRVSVEIADPVIPRLNNTIALSFGLDLTNCSNYCYNNNNRLSSYGTQFYAPEAGVQWNFFLTPQFSVFADVGIMLRSYGVYQDNFFDFYAMVGGRYHINKRIALTFRVGYPFVTFGPSFFL